MNDVQKLTNEKIKNGGILAMLYFDIHAKTKELVQELGSGFINEVIHKPGVVFALGEIDEPVGGGEGQNWSSSISIKVLTEDFLTLANLCIVHSPFSIEILRPEEIQLQLSDAHELLSTIGAASAEYKRYIITKVAKPQDLAAIEQDLKKRAEMGKKILEKKGA
ncbi:hypothetical protein HZC07_01180 [Candidatus Micrarchaeota archaeon]|nr:hypothetical protein [Candidatus Micrarchaeota archaeon]